MTTTRNALREERKTGQHERLFQPLTGNAYRVVGLAGSASQKEIYEASAALRRAMKLEVKRTTPFDAAWLGRVERNETELRDALGRLARPSQRIYERLFWFYEAEPVASLESLEDLPSAVEAVLARQKPSSRHDAALLSYAASLRFDPQINSAETWRRTLALWRETIEGDEFWSLLLAADLKGDFEQLATHGEIRELRQRALRLLTTPVVEMAKDALLETDDALCRRALSVLQSAQLPGTLLTEYENDILGPLEDEFEALCGRIFLLFGFNAGEHRGENERLRVANETLTKFKNEIRPTLRRLHELAGPRSRVTLRGCETAARHLLQLASVYLSAQKVVEGLTLLEKARALAPPGSEAEFLVEEELKIQGAGGRIEPRTEEEYFNSLAYHLRPQTEVFAAYDEPVSFGGGGKVQAARRGCFSELAEIIVPIILLMLCGWCIGSRTHKRSGSLNNLPNFNHVNSYNYNYRSTPVPNLNLQMRPLPPIPNLNLEPRSRVRRPPVQPSPHQKRRDNRKEL